MHLINENIDKIKLLCQQFSVDKLFLLKSDIADNMTDAALKDEKNNREINEIDFLVNFMKDKPLDFGDLLFDLKFSLEDTLNREVDVIEENTLKSPYFYKKIPDGRELVYES